MVIRFKLYALIYKLFCLSIDFEVLVVVLFQHCPMFEGRSGAGRRLVVASPAGGRVPENGGLCCFIGGDV
jgi:hypothetical protein